MIFKLRHLILSSAFIVTMTVGANENFSQLEQQQISIATPGLFGRSNAFSIDFDMFSASEWSFPYLSVKRKYQMIIRS